MYDILNSSFKLTASWHRGWQSPFLISVDAWETLGISGGLLRDLVYDVLVVGRYLGGLPPTSHDGQRNYKILHWINILFHYFFPPPAPPIKCMLSSKQFSKCVDKAIEVNIPWILLFFILHILAHCFLGPTSRSCICK